MSPVVGPPLVEMLGIRKAFPGVMAADGVDLRLERGEVLALLGENGAGKSSLMNILCGLYRQDAGEIRVRGEPADIRSPADAAALGIGMVHQNFMLVDTMTVAENLALGLPGLPFFPDMAAVKRSIVELGERYELRVDPSAMIWQLSVGEQQKVEILKQLYRNAEILILDEPTAVLTPKESRELGAVVRRMRDEGRGAVFITHKMEEVERFSDRVMVLRKGRAVAERPTRGVDRSELARMMVGSELAVDLGKKPFAPGRAVLELDGVRADNDRGLPALSGFSAAVRSGEILGVAGVAGNGQVELAEVVTGLRRATAGTIRLCGDDAANRSPLELIRRGVRHVPSDRIAVGAVGDMSVANNLAMKEYRQPTLSKGALLLPRKIVEFAKTMIAAFSIATPSPSTRVKFLSGGNIQKTILAREMESKGCLLVAVYPTRGLDVGATMAVRRELAARRDEGMAVLVVSEDLDELLSLADTIAVMYEGRAAGIMPGAGADPETLGLLMAGSGGAPAGGAPAVGAPAGRAPADDRPAGVAEHDSVAVATAEHETRAGKDVDA